MRKAGLVTEEGIENDARVRLYSVHPGAFQPVQQWLSQIEEMARAASYIPVPRRKFPAQPQAQDMSARAPRR